VLLKGECERCWLGHGGKVISVTIISRLKIREKFIMCLSSGNYLQVVYEKKAFLSFNVLVESFE
jgi:hypothetical protein